MLFAVIGFFNLCLCNFTSWLVATCAQSVRSYINTEHTLGVSEHTVLSKMFVIKGLDMRTFLFPCSVLVEAFCWTSSKCCPGKPERLNLDRRRKRISDSKTFGAPLHLSAAQASNAYSADSDSSSVASYDFILDSYGTVHLYLDPSSSEVLCASVLVKCFVRVF
jgi:hypothetical protein